MEKNVESIFKNNDCYQISEIVAYSGGTPDPSETPGYLGTTTDGRELILKYNIEDIIFNRVPILDINFFTNTAAGLQIEEGSPLQIIRITIATWYVSFRNLRNIIICCISNV